LETLSLHTIVPDGELLSFPKLLRCLKTLEATWPGSAALLATDNEIEGLTLWLRAPDEIGDYGAALWNRLRGMRSLKRLQLRGFPTSILMNLSLPSGVLKNSFTMSRSVWNVSESSRQAVSAPKGVNIWFCGCESRSPKDEEEIAFWKSLPFAHFEN
jgi:hypothetical protein